MAHIIDTKGEINMFYRVEQFIKAITAKITSEDIAFVKTYLNERESQLFFRLKPYEQRHCIDVARKLEAITRGEAEMIRVGLLHDIGKLVYPLNPIEKSIMVLLDRLTHSKIKKYPQWKLVKCYYEHPRLGYDLLSQIGNYEAGFLEMIKAHHQAESGNTKLALLKEADNAS